MGNGFWVLMLFRDLVSTCFPGHDGLRGFSFTSAVGGEAVFLARAFLGCTMGQEEEISQVVCEGLWGGVSDSAGEEG